MTDMVNHPPHYLAHPSGLECIDVTRGMTFTVGNAVKYVWRTDLKNGRQDLEKALWYLTDAIESQCDSVQPGWYTATLLKLEMVLDYETGLRFQFFDAIVEGNLERARDVVAAMLAEDL
jgi:hypothetical protein